MMSDAPFITRFAPSPTGLLHLGHAYSALVAYRTAQDQGGRFILRIEDIDHTRCRSDYEEAIFEDLAWLGLDWETPVRRQSDHLSDYQDTLKALREKGLIYRCFRTRKEVADAISRAPHAPPEGPEGAPFRGDPLPTDKERALIESGSPFAWRLSLSAARNYLGARYAELCFTEETLEGDNRTETPACPEKFGDVVIARKDAGTSYHLASVHDDAFHDITHVIRGDDLKEAPHLHTLLQTLLELPHPVYRHHRLITDDNGKRLAKRDRDMTLRQLRVDGVTPNQIMVRLGL